MITHREMKHVLYFILFLLDSHRFVAVRDVSVTSHRHKITVNVISRLPLPLVGHSSPTLGRIKAWDQR